MGLSALKKQIMKTEIPYLKILPSLQLFSSICLIFVTSLISIQTVVGRYKEHSEFVWLWTIILVFPIPFITLIVRAFGKPVIRPNPMKVLRAAYILSLIYFFALITILVLVIPFAWINAEIGYDTIFRNSIWFFLAFEAIIIFMIGYIFSFIRSPKMLVPEKELTGTTLKIKSLPFDELFQLDRRVVERFISEVIPECKRNIAENKMKLVFQVLNKFFQKHQLELPNTLLLLEREWTKVQNQKRLGVVNSNTLDALENQITYRLLGFLEEIQ